MTTVTRFKGSRLPAVQPGVQPAASSAWRALVAAVAVAPVRVPCQVDPAPFFAADEAVIAEAREACSWCPVQRECLEFAVLNGERHGVWGGREFSIDSRRRAARRELERVQAAHTQHTHASSSLVSASSLDTQTGAREGSDG